MSAPCIISASLPSFCQKLSKLVEIWRSSDKNNFAQFFWGTVYNTMQLDYDSKWKLSTAPPVCTHCAPKAKQRKQVSDESAGRSLYAQTGKILWWTCVNNISDKWWVHLTAYSDVTAATILNFTNYTARHSCRRTWVLPRFFCYLQSSFFLVYSARCVR